METKKNMFCMQSSFDKSNQNPRNKISNQRSCDKMKVKNRYKCLEKHKSSINSKGVKAKRLYNIQRLNLSNYINNKPILISKNECSELIRSSDQTLKYTERESSQCFNKSVNTCSNFPNISKHQDNLIEYSEKRLKTSRNNQIIRSYLNNSNGADSHERSRLIKFINYDKNEKLNIRAIRK